MKKVQIGDSFQIPAVDYNSFVDAAASFRAGQLDGGGSLVSTPSLHTIKVLNASFGGLSQYSYLGVVNVFDPPDGTSGGDTWSGPPILKGEIYNPEIHDFFVVLQESLQKDSIGAGLVQGVTPAKVVVRDVAHKFATPNTGFATVFETTATGPAKILWRQSENIGAPTWMLLELGVRQGPLIPIDLLRTGGVGGDATNPASWTYNVIDAITGAALASNQDPTATPHRFARPLGFASFANFGYAHFNKQKELVIGWVNETTEGGGGVGSVFPIALSSPQGSPGNLTTEASFTYTIRDGITGDLIASGINPSNLPHKFIRSVGQVNPATFGYAHRDNGDLVIGWINEILKAKKGSLFPVTLSLSGFFGEGIFPGSATSPATFLYTIRESLTGALLGSNVDATSSPHEFRRPIGRMSPATRGFAYLSGSQNLVVSWINEIPLTRRCQN